MLSFHKTIFRMIRVVVNHSTSLERNETGKSFFSVFSKIFLWFLGIVHNYLLYWINKGMQSVYYTKNKGCHTIIYTEQPWEFESV